MRNAQGKFSFRLEDGGGPHLVRVIHRRRDLSHPWRLRASIPVQSKVFDVSKKVEGETVSADVMWVQTGQGQLGVSRLFEVDNNSQPPRTQMNDQNLEILPARGPELVDQTARRKPPDGQWDEFWRRCRRKRKGRYAFVFRFAPWGHAISGQLSPALQRQSDQPSIPSRSLSHAAFRRGYAAIHSSDFRRSAAEALMLRRLPIRARSLRLP